MASRKMTFSLPADVASRFVARVPARERSQYVVAALTEKLGDRDRQLVLACDVANADLDLLAIEEEFAAINHDNLEPWAEPVKNAPDARAR